MKYLKLNRKCILIFIILLLSVFSVINLYGATFISPLYKNNYIKQILWIILGFIIMFMVYKLNFNLFIKYSGYLYIINIISLILVLFIGKTVNGASSWFKVGHISLQPSELFKFTYLLFIAKSINKEKSTGLKLLIKIIFITLVPCLLIFLEPDTGVVILYLFMMLGIMLSSNLKSKYTVILFIIGLTLLIVFLSFYFLNDDLFIKMFGTSFFYRMDRLLNFSNNSSYQLEKALIGIGASGPFGLGLTNTKIYIPEVTTDFAFDLIMCNFGFVTGIFIIIIYSVLLITLYKEIKMCRNGLYKNFLSGLFAMMFFQIGEHIFMNLGLTPITGITLPFISYGGSSLISYFVIFGLVLKITTNNSSYS